MTAAKKLQLISVEDYLAGELVSPIKHEYLGGVVYAMAGGKNRHNRIAGNIFGSLFMRLQGRQCQPFNSDTKIRVQLPTQTRFYYPDCSVVCEENPGDDSFQDEPVVVVEVLSNSTRRTDETEKRDDYLTLASLGSYLIVEQELARVVVHRRNQDAFVPEVYEGLDAVIPLPEIDTQLPLAEIYSRVDFSPETDSDVD